MLTKYQKRISGPLLDRIDTACLIEVPRVDCEKLSGDRMGESSESIRARVQAVPQSQRDRVEEMRWLQSSHLSRETSESLMCNADMRVGEIRQFCKLQPCPEQGRRNEGQSLIRG